MSRGKQKEHTLVTALLLRLLLLSGGGLSRRSSSSGGGRGISIGVGDAVLELVDLGPGVLGRDSSTEDLLVGVDDGVHDGRDSGDVSREGDAADGVDGVGQSAEQLLLADVEDGVREGLAVVVDLRDGHTVREGRDAHHVQQGGLGRTDLAAGLDELQIRRDFNGTTSDLGGDTESLEERRLTGFHTGVAGGDPDVTGGDGVGTSGRSDAVGQDLDAGLTEVGVGEDQTDVA